MLDNENKKDLLEVLNSGIILKENKKAGLYRIEVDINKSINHYIIYKSFKIKRTDYIYTVCKINNGLGQYSINYYRGTLFKSLEEKEIIFQFFLENKGIAIDGQIY